ncbi:hypothetical protein [Solilutibacter pythonis]|nr:hypothetical protein [Lysobacter pythonis]
MHTELTRTVGRLIEAGCHYRLDELATLYAPDLRILIFLEDGVLLSVDHAENMAFFRDLKAAGAPPLDNSARFEHAEVQGDTGYVIVSRRLDLGVGPKRVVFNLMLRHESAHGWRVFREHAVVLGDA